MRQGAHLNMVSVYEAALVEQSECEERDRSCKSASNAEVERRR